MTRPWRIICGCLTAAVISAALTGCQGQGPAPGPEPAPAEPAASVSAPPPAADLILPEGMTVGARIMPPAGFERAKVLEGTFAAWLRQLPVKPHGSPVLHFDGTEKTAKVHAAVVAMDIGKRDLQQCADAAMRLRAEYLYQANQRDAITFRFTNGFEADYSRWRAGQRIKVQGNLTQWQGGTAPADDYGTFRKYLDMVFAYAGTLSLAAELKPAALQDLEAGQVFIAGGSPGHCVIVMDVAVNGAGEKRFLLAQSYMPAQEIHLLKNPANPEGDPWYAPGDGEQLVTPQWTFSWDALRSW